MLFVPSLVPWAQTTHQQIIQTERSLQSWLGGGSQRRYLLLQPFFGSAGCDLRTMSLSQICEKQILIWNNWKLWSNQWLKHEIMKRLYTPSTYLSEEGSRLTWQGRVFAVTGLLFSLWDKVVITTPVDSSFISSSVGRRRNVTIYSFARLFLGSRR